MKPVTLVAYPILNSSLTNCIVLDPFGGSGSTLIACEQTNRICHMIELDEKFCDVIVKRFHQNFPENAIKLNGNPVNPELLFKDS
jgi:DNA modification methylase